jgi:hypothetical protein
MERDDLVDVSRVETFSHFTKQADDCCLITRSGRAYLLINFSIPKITLPQKPGDSPKLAKA